MEDKSKMKQYNIESTEETIEIDDENEVTEEEKNQPKKRGRKPKNKPSEDDNAKITPKKRGRRPKDKTYTIISNYKEVPSEIEEDNIILHLPVETEGIIVGVENDEKIDTNGVLKYDPNLKEPAPYEPMNSMRSNYALISDKMQEKLSELDEETDDISVSFIKKEEMQIKCGNDEINIREIGFEEEVNDHFKVLKKAKILKIFANEENKKDWELSTDTCCYYCTEKFQTVPIGIPMRYFKGKFYCRDIFCSFNCAASYIFFGYDFRFNFKKWEYYSLLCLMASKIQKELGLECINSKVKLAENRNLLIKFGGPLSISQFRKNFYVLDTQYSMLYPPLSCMYPQIEVANFVNVHRQKAQLLNSESRFSFGDSRSTISDLRLKREKPLIQKKNTLEEYMSLKIN